MKKRVLTLIITGLVMITSLLIGCDNASTTTISQKNGANKAVLNLWLMEPQDRKVMNDMIAKYQEKTGNAVKVTYISKNDYGSRIDAAVASGHTPDVSYIDQTLVPRLAADNVIIPLDAYASGKNGIDNSKYYKGALDSNIVNNQLYGLPFTQGCIVLFYNKDLVPTPPTTWTEWMYMAKKVYKKSKIAAMNVPGGGGFGAWLFPAFVASSGGTMINSDKTTVAFDQQPSIDALNFLLQMKQYSDQDVLNRNNAFGNGIVATEVSGIWELENLKKNFPNLHFGTALIPKNHSNDPHATNIGGDNLAIYKTCKNREVAWDLIKFLSYNSDNNANIAYIYDNFPTLLEAGQDTRYQSDENLKIFIEQLKTAQVRPQLPVWNKINDEIIGKLLDDALTKKSNSVDALKTGAQDADVMIKQFQK